MESWRYDLYQVLLTDSQEHSPVGKNDAFKQGLHIYKVMNHNL